MRIKEAVDPSKSVETQKHANAYDMLVRIASKVNRNVVLENSVILP